MRPQSLVNGLLTASLFAASCLGTLALFGAVPMLPHLTAQLAALLPDLPELAYDTPPSQPIRHHRRAWVAELPDGVQPRSVDVLRYRMPR